MEQRFLSKINKIDGGCWEWTGSRMGKYGAFNGSGSHRFAYELWKGSIPKGLVIMHSCDNPPCCNPNHLELGTYSQNTKQMYSKGRQPKNTTKSRGEKHGSAKLTEDAVREIRILRGFGFKLKELSILYNISLSVIGFIIKKKIWKNI